MTFYKVKLVMEADNPLELQKTIDILQNYLTSTQDVYLDTYEQMDDDHIKAFFDWDDIQLKEYKS